MTRTPHHSRFTSKNRKFCPPPSFRRMSRAGGYFCATVRFSSYAPSVRHSSVVLVIAYPRLSGHTCVTNNRKEADRLCLRPKNLCAQIPLELHAKVCEAREQSEQTIRQYITMPPKRWTACASKTAVPGSVWTRPGRMGWAWTPRPILSPSPAPAIPKYGGDPPGAGGQAGGHHQGGLHRRLRDDPPERYHDIVWDALPIHNRTTDPQRVREFYEKVCKA